jgi:hypothetical protein
MRWALLPLAAWVVAATCGGTDSDPAGASSGGLGGGTTSTTSTGAGACDPGFVVCDGACVQLDADPANCGACGRDCRGQPCQASMCGAIALATGQESPHALAVDEGGVYWGTFEAVKLSGQVWQQRFDAVAPTSTPTDGVEPRAIAVDGVYLYWIGVQKGMTTPNLERVCLTQSGCDPASIVLGQEGEGLAVDETSIYWSAPEGAIRRIDKDAFDMFVELDTSQIGPRGLAVRDGHVYWASAGSALDELGPRIARIPTVPTMMGPEIVVLDGDPPRQIAVGDSAVYWTNLGGGVLSHPKEPDMNPGTLLGEERELPFGVAVDALHVYWTDSSLGKVFRAPIGGGPAVTLAAGQHTPLSIAVNATHVVWVNAGVTDLPGTGAVMMVAK